MGVNDYYRRAGGYPDNRLQPDRSCSYDYEQEMKAFRQYGIQPAAAIAMDEKDISGKKKEAAAATGGNDKEKT